MVANSRISTTLPVVDMNRAKKFYRDTLGLRIKMEDEMGVGFETNAGCDIYLYQRSPTKADHTVLAFEVENIESEVRELRNKGIKFEEYDIPEMHIRTVNGIASYTSKDWETKSAWFKDPEGNILSLVQMVRVGSRREPEQVGARR
jgi:catechol 2,3-dioxygenase-like lactoylglutathione lyase family enzyme